MQKRLRTLPILAVIVVLAAGGILAAGCEMCCNSSRGSGSIMITDPATNESHKATVSYSVECDGSYVQGSARSVRGRLQYQDHKPWKKNGSSKAESVSIHGQVGDVANTETLAADPFFSAQLQNYSGDQEKICSENLNFAAFTGTYRPQPATLGDGGTFTVTVWDKGKPGPSAEDTFQIELTGGVFDGYKVSGVLAAGNIKAL